MSAELMSLCLSFQSDAPELDSRVEYDRQAKAFATQLSNVSAQHFTKGAETQQDVLELLNPTVNSIAYAFALKARVLAGAGTDPKTPKQIPDPLKPGGHVWNRIASFMELFDPIQMRYAGNEWRFLLEFIDRASRIMGVPGAAISTLRSGLLQLDPTTGTFTETHLAFLRLCMETRSYSAACPILDNYVHSLPGAIPKPVLEQVEYSLPAAVHTNSGEWITKNADFTGKLTIQDVQEYYVLGAMAYIGQRQFKKAKNFLEHVFVVPSANTSNGLMLEAYKKWILVTCLAKGQVSSLPRTANPTAIKQIKACAKPYEALGDAFAQVHNPAKLKAQINAGQDIWADDGNAGLVKELQLHQSRVYISRLARTYSAIPVSNISNLLGSSVDDVTQYLQDLINQGHLNAELQRTGASGETVVLRFFLDPTQGPLAKTEKQQQEALLKQAGRTNVLAEQVKSADYRLSLTKEYAEWNKRQNKKQAANGAGDAMDTSWDDGGIAEEDLMA